MISNVKPFEFTNQDGKTVTEKDLEGKVVVVEYFFTTCPGICPIMNTNMRKVYDKFKDEKDFLILSHTCQPNVDSVPLLKRYADSMQVNTNKWIFLTGDKEKLYYMARNSYMIDDPNDILAPVDEDFMHSQLWAVVNKKGEIKKIFDGMKDKEVEAAMRYIKRILK